MDAGRWEATVNTEELIAAVATTVPPRKFRLFMAAWVRHVRPVGSLAVVEDAVRVAERFADGLIEVRRVEEFYRQVRKGWADTELPWLLNPSLKRSAEAAFFLCRAADPWDRRDRLPPDEQAAFDRRVAERSRVLREVLGNPFRPVRLDDRWLTTTVRSLSRGAYQHGAFDRLPILADALEDAGCDDGELLVHLRAGGPHYRGCWAVDAVLGRPVTC